MHLEAEPKVLGARVPPHSKRCHGVRPHHWPYGPVAAGDCRRRRRCCSCCCCCCCFVFTLFLSSLFPSVCSSVRLRVCGLCSPAPSCSSHWTPVICGVPYYRWFPGRGVLRRGSIVWTGPSNPSLPSLRQTALHGGRHFFCSRLVDLR